MIPAQNFYAPSRPINYEDGGDPGHDVGHIPSLIAAVASAPNPQAAAALAVDSIINLLGSTFARAPIDALTRDFLYTAAQRLRGTGCLIFGIGRRIA